MLPNLLVIGAMKGATTSLWEYLRSHPQVHMSPVKEIHYFDADRQYERGPDWYSSHFSGAGPEHVVVGEATPAYSRFPLHRDVPLRAAQLVPDARLIYVLREPVARIRSHYLHDRSLGLESAPFEQAVLQRSTYVDTSRYAMQLDQWLRHYPRDRVLVLTSERLRAHQVETMQQVYRFLGVDETWQPPSRELHRTEDKHVPRPAAHRLRTSRLGSYVSESAPPALRPALNLAWSLTRYHPRTTGADIDARLRAVLHDLLRDDVHRLPEHLGPEFDCWGI